MLLIRRHARLMFRRRLFSPFTLILPAAFHDAIDAASLSLMMPLLLRDIRLRHDIFRRRFCYDDVLIIYFDADFRADYAFRCFRFRRLFSFAATVAQPQPLLPPLIFSPC